jgi:uncharacterized protein YggE
MRTHVLIALITLAAIPAFAETAPGTVEVQGVAEVSVPPDSAVLRLSIDAWERSRDGAMKTVDDTWAKVKGKIPRAARVNTEVLSLNESTKYFGEVRKHGFQAARAFEIRTRDLQGLDRLISSLVDAGVTRIVELRFEASSLSAHKAKARIEAVKAAKDKAQAMAAAVGQRVGKAISLSEVSAGRISRVGSSYTNVSIEAVSAGGVPAAGAVKATLTVKAVFELS